MASFSCVNTIEAAQAAMISGEPVAVRVGLDHIWQCGVIMGLRWSGWFNSLSKDIPRRCTISMYPEGTFTLIEFDAAFPWNK